MKLRSEKIGAALFAAAVLLCGVVAIVMSSCVTTGVSDIYPDDIRQMCVDASAYARNCIETVDGKALPDLLGVEVVKRPGTKKYKNGWGWESPEWGGMPVCGLAGRRGNRSYIQIGCNPANGGEVSMTALAHEFGHHWRMQVHDAKHNPAYSSCFVSWNEPPGVRRVMFLDEDNWEIVDYPE